jgi:uncharacterized Zn-binding protein involved in type VI secretion
MPGPSTPPAARVGDPVVTARGRGVVLPPGAVRVLIEGRPAARLGDLVDVPGGPAVPILEGCPVVATQGRPAARVGDKTGANGVIVRGAAQVFIGAPNEHHCLDAAARMHAPFVRRG